MKQSGVVSMVQTGGGGRQQGDGGKAVREGESSWWKQLSVVFSQVTATRGN